MPSPDRKKPWKALRKRTLMTRLQLFEARAEASLKSHLSRQRREFEAKERRLHAHISALKAGHFLRQNIDALLANLAHATGISVWSGPHADGKRGITLSYTGHVDSKPDMPVFVATVNFFTCEVTLQAARPITGIENVQFPAGATGHLKREALLAADEFSTACTQALGLERASA